MKRVAILKYIIFAERDFITNFMKFAENPISKHSTLSSDDENLSQNVFFTEFYGASRHHQLGTANMTFKDIITIKILH